MSANDNSVPSIDDMKRVIKAHHEHGVRKLAEKRAAREKLNLEIALLVAQVAEAERLVKALEPRKRKP